MQLHKLFNYNWSFIWIIHDQKTTLWK